jgi:hypothetical protein
MIKEEMKTNVEALKMSVYRSTMDKMQVFCMEPFGEGNPTIGSVYTDNPDEPTYTYGFKLTHYNHLREPQMTVLVNVMDKSYYGILSISKDGVVCSDKEIIPDVVKQWLDVDFNNPKEEEIKRINEEMEKWYTIQSIKDEVNGLDFLQKDTINSLFYDEIQKLQQLHLMEEELKDYDNFQYQKFVKNCIESGVVQFPNYIVAEWNGLHDNDKPTTLEVKFKPASVRIVYQTKWGKKDYDYMSNLTISPLKGGKWSFTNTTEITPYGVPYTKVMEGTFTKLQFDTMLKDVWKSYKEVDDYKEQFEADMEYFVENTGVKISDMKPLIGEWIVDGDKLIKK